MLKNVFLSEKFAYFTPNNSYTPKFLYRDQLPHWQVSKLIAGTNQQIGAQFFDF
jgi:hypothetical protein